MHNIFKTLDNNCYEQTDSAVRGITISEFTKLQNEGTTEIDCPEEYQVEPRIFTNAESRKIFNNKVNKLLSETDWVHLREKDKIALNKSKHPKFLQYCQYREDLRNLDKQEGFDITNPVFPDKPK